MLGNGKSIYPFSFNKIEEKQPGEGVRPTFLFLSSLVFISVFTLSFLAFIYLNYHTIFSLPQFLIFFCTCYSTQGIFLATSRSSCVLISHIVVCMCLCCGTSMNAGKTSAVQMQLKCFYDKWSKTGYFFGSELKTF